MKKYANAQIIGAVGTAATRDSTFISLFLDHPGMLLFKASNVIKTLETYSYIKSISDELTLLCIALDEETSQ